MSGITSSKGASYLGRTHRSSRPLLKFSSSFRHLPIPGTPVARWVPESAAVSGGNLTWSDVSGNGWHTTAIAGPLVVEGLNGQNAVDPNGAYRLAVSTTSSPLNSATAFSAFCLLKTPLTGSNLYSAFGSSSFGGTGTNILNLELVSAFPSWFNVRACNTSNTEISMGASGFAVSGENWYAVLLTWDGSTVTLYINGVSITSTSFSGTLKNTSFGFYIFGPAYSTGAFNFGLGSRMHELTLWTSALSAGDRSKLWAYSRGRYGV